MNDEGSWLWSLVTLVGAIVIVCALMVANCGDGQSERLTRSVEAQGLTNVAIGDWAPWSCSESDDIKRNFSATNSQGKRVEGVVCCGLVAKGCTLRW